MKTSIITMILLIAAVSMTAAEDTPSMWMEQTADGSIDLMVSTSEASSGANAWLYFDPAGINITDMDFTESPWQPNDGPGWSNQGDHVIMVLTNFSGVPAGEYRIAHISIDCITQGSTSDITIDKAEPIGVVAYPLTYTCTTTIDEPEISIGDCTGATTIPIMITSASNVGSVDVTLLYDPAVATVTAVSGGDMDYTFTNTEHANEGWIRIGAIQGESDGLSGQFTLLNVDLSPVGSNAQCDLVLEVTTYKDSTPACAAMTYTIDNGVYVSSKNGDANGDDVVDIADAAYIAKHALGFAGYETIDESTADVTGDGIVDLSDSMYLMKHVLGIAGYEELR